MDTTVTSPGTAGATCYKRSRPVVSPHGDLRIYRDDNPGVLMAEYHKGEWKHAIVVDEAEPKVHWKDLAIELGTSLQISEQARLQALARLQQALKAEGS